MPRVFSRKRLPIPLTVEHHPRAAIGREAFRYLRTSLEYSTAEHPPRVIMTTSCVPEEGKSTICSNLASIFAEKGVKTLVIDADLRRPILHKAFGQSRCPGLSDVLTGQRSYADAIVPLDIPNLHFLPAGPGTPSPLNLLDSQSMSTLLEELKNEFAVIILDSAPCDAVADSLVLAQKVDGVCLVVSLGSTSLEVLDSTVGRLQSMDTCILGVIYNRAKAEVLASSYGYSYGYGKQYGKGYGHPYVNPPSEKTS